MGQLGQRDCPLIRQIAQTAITQLLENLLPTLIESCREGTQDLFKDGQELRLTVGDRQLLRLKFGEDQ